MKRPIYILFQYDVTSVNMPPRQLGAVSNSIFAIFCILLISFIFSGNVMAQQKSTNVQQAEAQLIVVNEKITEIDSKINAINTRIAGVPPENVDPAVLVKLGDLQLTKDQYIREKISIEAVLDNDQLIELNN